MRAYRLSKRGSGLEMLEGRLLLSTTFSFQGGTLVCLGDNSPNSVIVSDSGGGRIQVRAENQAKWSSFSGVSRVVIRTGAGDDSVLYRLSGDVTTARAVSIDTGGGNDRVQLQSDRSGLSFSAPLSFSVTCGAGNDVCATSLGDLVLGKGAKSPSDKFIKLQWFCGAGDDDCDDNVTLAPGSTGGVDISVDGGAGDDHITERCSPSASPPTPSAAAADYYLKLDLRGASGIDQIDADVVCPDGATPSSVRLDGGSGDDSVSSNVVSAPSSSSLRAGAVDMFLKVQLLGGDGADSLSSQLSVDPACFGGVASSVSGGSGDDSIFIKMPSTSAAAVDYFLKFVAMGDSGNDDISADMTLCPGGAASNELSLDGGAGQDTLACRVSGDSVPAASSNGTPGVSLSSPVLKLSLVGGAGEDDVSADMTIQPGQLGEVDASLDGGAGDDAVDFSWGATNPGSFSGGGGGGAVAAYDAFLKLDCVGGQGNDRISTDLAFSSGSAQTDEISCDGGIGDDAIFMKMHWVAPPAGSSSTASPFIKIECVGGAGDDQVSVDMTLPPSSVSGLDATLDGGSGDDALHADLGGGSDHSSVLVMGGGGADSARVSSNVSVFDVADVYADAVV